MEISLEKVDQVKERTGSTYKEAKEALEICGGDVLEAIIYIEGQNEIRFACQSIREMKGNCHETW